MPGAGTETAAQVRGGFWYNWAMLKDIVTSMTLVNGVTQDERQAWERFVKVYRDPMCEFARSQAAFLGMSETEAEDAVFTLFERFAQHKEKFDPSRGSLRNWLMMRLKNLLLDTARLRASERERADRALEDGAQGDSERQREWKDAQLAIMRRALKIVLEEADPRTREVFTRVALEDCDPSKVAADFGLTANAVYQIKNRVIAKVRRITEEDPLNG